jgi:hypothetical protein
VVLPGICEARKKNSIGFSSNLKMEMISLAAQRGGGGGKPFEGVGNPFKSFGWCHEFLNNNI